VTIEYSAPPPVFQQLLGQIEQSWETSGLKGSGECGLLLPLIPRHRHATEGLREGVLSVCLAAGQYRYYVLRGAAFLLTRSAIAAAVSLIKYR
jgi:hypothetical protein